MVLRKQKLLSCISPCTQSGLEIGPLNRPVVTKDESNGMIKYIDHTSTENLRNKYANDRSVDVAEIVSIDYVWGANTLTELVAGNLFDYVIASHVIEHVPDMIGWLKEVADILEDNGILSLAVPDKRYTFDCLRDLTTPGMLIEANLRQYRRPSPQAVFDHVSHFTPVTAEEAWKGLNTKALQPMHSLIDAYRLAKDCFLNEHYHDVHVNVFTPLSFLNLLEKLSHLGLVDYIVKDFYDTTLNTFEFFVSLERIPRKFVKEEALVLQLVGLEAAKSRLSDGM